MNVSLWKKKENLPSKIVCIFNVFGFMVTLYGWFFPSDVLQASINQALIILFFQHFTLHLLGSLCWNLKIH